MSLGLTAYGVAAALPMTENPTADFSDTPWWVALIKAVGIFVYLLISTLLVIWFERRVIGRMQQRPGPNRNGPFGLLQTLADGMKSMLKEDITPARAEKLIYTLAPLIAATMAFVSFAIIPLGVFRKMFGSRQSLQLLVKPKSPDVVKAAMDDATVALRIERRLRPAQENNWGMFTSDTLLGIYEQATKGLFAVLIGIVALSLVVTGPLAQAIGDTIGLGSTAVTVWNIAKWPVLAAVVRDTGTDLRHGCSVDIASTTDCNA
mgnify:CR=1 FL=1